MCERIKPPKESELGDAVDNETAAVADDVGAAGTGASADMNEDTDSDTNEVMSPEPKERERD